MSFPRLVYQSPGIWRAGSVTYTFQAVEDQAALDAALTSGWHASMVDALNPPAPPPPPAPAPALSQEPEAAADDNAPPTREEMEAQATRMGLQIDRRWSDKTLLAKIEEALKADEGL